jgi:hypothetical protein
MLDALLADRITNGGVPPPLRPFTMTPADGARLYGRVAAARAAWSGVAMDDDGFRVMMRTYAARVKCDPRVAAKLIFAEPHEPVVIAAFLAGQDGATPAPLSAAVPAGAKLVDVVVGHMSLVDLFFRIAGNALTTAGVPPSALVPPWLGRSKWLEFVLPLLLLGYANPAARLQWGEHHATIDCGVFTDVRTKRTFVSWDEWSNIAHRLSPPHDGDVSIAGKKLLPLLAFMTARKIV